MSSSYNYKSQLLPSIQLQKKSTHFRVLCSIWLTLIMELTYISFPSKPTVTVVPFLLAEAFPPLNVPIDS